MELLGQLQDTMYIPPAVSLRVLNKRLNHIIRNHGNTMTPDAFCELIQYDLPSDFKMKVFQELCKGVASSSGNIAVEDFRDILLLFERGSRLERLPFLFRLYQSETGTINFSNFIDMLSLKLRQLQIKLSQVELFRMAQTILGSAQGVYDYESLLNVLRKWENMDLMLGDTILVNLFSEPRIPIGISNIRVPNFFLKRSKLTARFFVCEILFYTMLLVIIGMYTWMNRPMAADVLNQRIFNIENNTAPLNDFEADRDRLMSQDFHPAKESSWNMKETLPIRGIVPDLIMFCTNYLSLHLFLVAISSLESLRILFVQNPFNKFIHSEDVRLALWTFAGFVTVFSVLEIPLILLSDDPIKHESLFFESWEAILCLSIAKLLLILSALSFRLPEVYNRITHWFSDVTQLNMSLVLMINLIQHDSFLAWAVLIMAAHVLDAAFFHNIEQHTVNVRSCTPGGGMVLTTDQVECNVGDLFFVTIDQIGVTNAIPAFVLSKNMSSMRIQLQATSWQTRVFRKFLCLIGKKIMQKKGTGTDHGNGQAEQSGTSRRDEGHSENPESRSVESRHELNNLTISSKRLETHPDSNIVFSFRDQSENNHSITLRIPLGLTARIHGSYQNIDFTTLRGYRSVRFLITPKSAGAVAGYLLERAALCPRRYPQKIFLYLAADAMSSVVWFIKMLVRLETSQTDNHDLKHLGQARDSCDQCRFFYKIAHGMKEFFEVWNTVINIAIAMLAGRSKSVDYLRSCVVHEITECNEVVDYVLCDADFPNRDQLISSDVPTDVVNF